MNRKPSILVVLLTVFIDLVGFGIVVPLVPIFSRHYGASGTTMPKPTRSMKTVSRTTRMDGLRFIFATGEV